MPGLAQRTRQLENELRQETVDVVAEDRGHGVEQLRVQRQRPKHRVGAVDAEQLGQPLRQRATCSRQGRFLHDVGVADIGASVGHFRHAGGFGLQLHTPLWREKSRQHDKPVVVPRSQLGGGERHGR